ncbi:MAG: hypothetical protein E6R04_09305 [Spirochaetes bacterium]|nr:MAG: hypothetical protein E6R04_09305 [Spirochaetota bacterium]
MHFIIIKGTEAETQLRELKEYAEKPENVLDLGKSKTQEQINSLLDSHNYTRVLTLRDPSGLAGTYRVCFSIDLLTALQQEGTDPTAPIQNIDLRLRHLSVQREEGYPDPIAAFTLAKFLGFTGGVDEWTISHHPTIQNTVAIVQAMDFDKPHHIILMPPPSAQGARQ